MLPVSTPVIPQTSSAELPNHHQTKPCWRPAHKGGRAGPACLPQRITSYLGEVSQLRPHPAQLVEHAGVEGCLLLAAAAQLLLVAVVDARPVCGEGLGAVRPDAPGDSTGTEPSANTAQSSSASLSPISARAKGRSAALRSQERLNLLSSHYLIQISVKFPSLWLQLITAITQLICGDFCWVDVHSSSTGHLCSAK